VEIDFAHDGFSGKVTVGVTSNTDPPTLGAREEARGYAVCTATIAYSGGGYHALMGWIQLVRSSDNKYAGERFEMDPARFFEDSPAPYAFYGFAPTLFDAPSRDERGPMTWLAHSFLAVTPRDVGQRKLVVPLVGFAWGFDIDHDREISIVDPIRLTAADWLHHVPYLTDGYRTWEFQSPDRFR
jgi:hypothetical protein